MRPHATIFITLLALAFGGACSSGDGSEPIGSTTPPEAEAFCTSGPESFDSVGTVLDGLEAPLRSIAAGQYTEAVKPVREVYVGFDSAREALRELAESAPSVISDEVTAMSDGFLAVFDAFPPEDQFISALESGDSRQIEAVLAQVATFQTTASETFASAEVRDAGQSVRAYVTANCNSAPTSTSAD